MTDSENRVGVWLVGIVLFCCPLLIIKLGNRFDYENIKILFLSIMVFFMATHFGYRYYRIGRLDLVVTTYLKIHFLFVLSALLSWSFSNDKYVSYWGDMSIPSGSLVTVLLTFFFLFFCTQYVRTFKIAMNLIAVLCTSGLIMAIYAIFQYFGVDLIFGKLDFGVRAFSTIGQPVGLGTYLGAITLMSAIFIFHGKKKTSFFFILIWALLFNSVFSSGSRAPIFFLIGMHFFIFLFLFCLKSRFAIDWLNRKIAILVGLIIFLFGIHFSNSSNTLVKKSSGEKLSLGMQIRLSWWQSGWQIFKAHPIFGVGAENIDSHYKKVKPVNDNYFETWSSRLNKLHNELMQVFATQGLIGGFIYSLIILYTLSVFLSSFANIKTKENREVIVFILCAFFYIFLCNLLAFNFFVTQYLYFICPMLILVLVNTHLNKAITLCKNKSLLVCGVVFVLSLMIIFLNFNRINSIKHFYVANSHLKEGNYSGAFESITTAIEYDNQNFDFYCLRALVTANALHFQIKQKSQIALSPILKEIEIDLNQCVNLGSQNHIAFENAANVYVSMSDLDGQFRFKAISFLNESIRLYDSNPRSYYLRGLIQIDAKESKRAVDDLNYSLKLKRNYLPAVIEKIRFFYEQNNLTEAQAAIRDFIVLIPENKKYVDFSDILVKSFGSILGFTKSFQDKSSEELLINFAQDEQKKEADLKDQPLDK